MVNEIMNFIAQHDPEVGKAIEAEDARQKRNIELIASEKYRFRSCYGCNGNGSDQQIRGRFPWQTLLRRMRVRRCRRKYCD